MSNMLDGFISKRRSGDNYAIALRSHLLKHFRVECALQPDLKGEDHEKHARELIEKGNFTIVLLGSEGLNRKGSSEPGFQHSEILSALKHYKRCKQDDIPYAIFFVQLTDSPDEREISAARRMIGELPGGNERFANWRTAPTKNKNRDWIQSIKTVSADVRDFLEESRIKPILESGSHSVSSNDGRLSTDNIELTPAEERYLERNLSLIHI